MRTATAIAALLLTLPSGGCVAAAAAGAGFGYWQYDKNETVSDFETDFDSAWRASVAGVKDFADLPPVTTTTLAGTSGELEGEGFRVRVEEHPDGKTRVRVRVGTFDTEENRRLAGLVMESIETQLDG